MPSSCEVYMIKECNVITRNDKVSVVLFDDKKFRFQLINQLNILHIFNLIKETIPSFLKKNMTKRKPRNLLKIEYKRRIMKI